MRDVLAKRLDDLRTAIEQAGLKGIILNQPAYIFHLTNWLPPAWANVALVVSLSDLTLVTPFPPDDVEPVWSNAIIVDSPDQIVAGLQQAISENKLTSTTIGAVFSALPASIALPLSLHIQLADAESLMHDVTAVKDAAAQGAIRERVGYLDRAFEAIQATIQPGVSELQVYGAAFTALVQAVGSPITLDCNIGAGKHALEDEPQPSSKLLETGEVVMIDLYPVMAGYAADYTRNFVVGTPTDQQMAQHRVLENALSAAEAALRPGVLAADIDRRVHQVIENEGYGSYAYQHHTGHAFGLTIPEPPWLLPDDQTPLRAGMVIAVEPGIYHPENGGMRLEGNYIITEDGCDSLAKFPAQLIACQ